MRYLVEGRLLVEHVDEHSVSAQCRGSSGAVYRLGFKPGEWYCSCPVRGACSHKYALWSVVVRPGALP
jgi:uncharacterized Zn finger protein